MFKIMLYLTPQQRSHPAVAHALKVREALAFGSYLQFFRLHDKTPNLGRFLTALILPTMRMRALRRMAKTFNLRSISKFAFVILDLRPQNPPLKPASKTRL
jgi:hypothetical protein